MSTHTADTTLSSADEPPDMSFARYVMAHIHHCYAPALDLIECEILDALLQGLSVEVIAHTSQLHIDTVRRAVKHIEECYGGPTPQQLINNCNNRRWSSAIYVTNTPTSHSNE